MRKVGMHAARDPGRVAGNSEVVPGKSDYRTSARSQCPVNHGQNRLGLSSRRESIPNMKVLGFVILATIFEAVGDVLMRTALQSRYAMAGRIGLFGLASVLLALYGLFLNLAPVEFATVTGIYLASLFAMFQIVNYIFFRTVPTTGVLVGGCFIAAGSAIIYFWK